MTRERSTLETIAAVDPTIRDEWHVVATIAELPLNRTKTTRLLGVPIAVARWGEDEIGVWPNDGQFRSGQAIDSAMAGKSLPIVRRFGCVWTTLGAPDRDLFAIPEVDEPDRLNINACTVGIHTSAPRAIENFCDLAHFPFVHGGYLGTEAQPQVAAYDVTSSADGRELMASRCRFFQPATPSTSSDGFVAEYVYRVPHPYCVLLYKAKESRPDRRDVVAMFCQPLDEESLNASMFGSLLQDTSIYASDIVAFRSFQLLLIAQDKGILESQRPRRLPLDTAGEIPVRADATSVAYRRWLRARGVRYGVVPLEARATRAAQG